MHVHNQKTCLDVFTCEMFFLKGGLMILKALPMLKAFGSKRTKGMEQVVKNSTVSFSVYNLFTIQSLLSH